MAGSKYLNTQMQRPDHPRIRAWKSYSSDPFVHRMNVEIRRERDALTYLPPRLFLFFYDLEGKVIRMDEAPWEIELEEWLIDERKIKAIDTDNEKLRFSLLLKPALRPILIQFGDGYFNAVLVEMLRAEKFHNHPEVANMLKGIYRSNPQAASYKDCQARIEYEFTGLWKKLKALYDDDDYADDVLGGAIARYLDERFSITSSRELGFI